MIYRRLVLSCSVVQNCQVDICQAVDGVAVRVFTSQRSVQIRLGQFNLYQ